MSESLVRWLKATCDRYRLEPVAIYRANPGHEWPLVANNEADLQAQLEAGDHFLPLPREPATLANILETSVADFVLSEVGSLSGATARRGSERGYPDIETSGSVFGGGHHAVEIKVARRRKGGKRTQSRITLYTGNTYFRYPKLHWPSTFRPFEEYRSHLDIVVLYTLDVESIRRAADVEVLVQEAWRIASRQRSSTTREYVGAVNLIDDLRRGVGEFETEEQFYSYWRKYGFKIGKAVQQQLDRLLARED